MTQTYISADTKHIVTPWRADLASLVPHAQAMTYQGERVLVLPNRAEEARLARNLGVAIPAPILTRYDWCRQKPWDIQKTTAALLTESPRAYVLNSMGCGKTRSVLFAFDWMRQVGVHQRMLVSAPLSTLTPVWENEVFRWFPHLRRKVLYGPKQKRLELLAEEAEVYIINHHGIALIRDELVAKGFNLFVIDELAILRNKRTQLWKAHSTVVNQATHAWGLTGSPTPSAPTDAWAQVRLLTPGRVPRSFLGFQDQTMQRITQFKLTPRKDANDVVHKAMQPSVRFTRDDIAELPPTSYVNREVKLDPVAQKAYDMLFNKMVTMTNKGDTITAVNEGVLQIKLLQVACGYIYTDADTAGQKTVYELPNTARLSALEEVISETDRKVLVFVPFVHAIEGVAEHLRKAGHDVGVVYGATSRGQRDAIFNGFQNGTTPRIIVAHPQTMAHGLTLTAANVIVWYAPVPSLEFYEQANARIVRPSQTSKTLIVHLFGTPVERHTYRRLKEKGSMQGMLLELFASQELDY
jgi:SNF2 family DNA or RNA helicase